MNQHQNIEQMWDAYRDGELSADQVVQFEQYLADHPDQKALYDAESQWLISLHDQPMIEAQPFAAGSVNATSNRAFAAAVLDKWDEESRPVLARIHWKSAAFSAGWLVAAAAIAIAMWINAPEATTNPSGSNSTVAVGGFDGGEQANYPRRDRRHPLTSLVQDMDQTYEEQPTNVFAAFGSLMNLSNVEVTPIQQASYQER